MFRMTRRIWRVTADHHVYTGDDRVRELRLSPMIMVIASTPSTNGEIINGRRRLVEFSLEHAEREQLRVVSAALHVRAIIVAPRRTPRRRLRYTLWAFSEGTRGGWRLAGSVRRDPRRAWQRIDVTAAARGWLRTGHARLMLDCSGCRGRVRLALEGPDRPTLEVRAQAPLASRRSRRRALDCSAAPRDRCCREIYWVSFRQLGWDDWIVAPDGYFANYCRGACTRTPDTFVNYHSHVVEEASRQNHVAGYAPCCAPLRFSQLSLIYFGADSTIIKRDLPQMVVEECGCP